MIFNPQGPRAHQTATDLSTHTSLHATVSSPWVINLLGRRCGRRGGCRLTGQGKALRRFHT